LRSVLNTDPVFISNGAPRLGMGVDAADCDAGGWQDLFVANVDQEMFSLYKNKAKPSPHVARPNGVAEATRLLSGWSLKFFDYDIDGNIDRFLANGHPDDMIEHYAANVKYAEPILLFHHQGSGLKNVSDKAGPAF
jgi:hypothetical protein